MGSDGEEEVSAVKQIKDRKRGIHRLDLLALYLLFCLYNTTINLRSYNLNWPKKFIAE